MMYAEDFDGLYPYNHFSVQVGGRWLEWWTVMQPYIKNWQAFRCPSNTTINIYNGINYGKRGCTDNVLSGEDSSNFWYGQVAQMEAPAETIAFGEWGRGNGHRLCPHWHAGTTYYGFVNPQVHNDGSNYCFYDGHVKWLKYNATYSGTRNMWLMRKTGAVPTSGPPAWPWP